MWVHVLGYLLGFVELVQLIDPNILIPKWHHLQKLMADFNSLSLDLFGNLIK